MTVESALGAVIPTVTSGTVNVPGEALGVESVTVVSDLIVPLVPEIAPGLGSVSIWP